MIAIFCPASIETLLLQAFWVFIPGLRRPRSFDFLVLLVASCVAWEQG